MSDQMTPSDDESLNYVPIDPAQFSQYFDFTNTTQKNQEKEDTRRTLAAREQQRGSERKWCLKKAS